jgi:hypothetical protein
MGTIKKLNDTKRFIEYFVYIYNGCTGWVTVAVTESFYSTAYGMVQTTLTTFVGKGRKIIYLVSPKILSLHYNLAKQFAPT